MVYIAWALGFLGKKKNPGDSNAVSWDGVGGSHLLRGSWGELFRVGIFAGRDKRSWGLIFSLTALSFSLVGGSLFNYANSKIPADQHRKCRPDVSGYLCIRCRMSRTLPSFLLIYKSQWWCLLSNPWPGRSDPLQGQGDCTTQTHLRESEYLARSCVIWPNQRCMQGQPWEKCKVGKTAFPPLTPPSRVTPLPSTPPSGF